ncbi:MAG: acyltransferase [Eubacteriales bacterium]
MKERRLEHLDMAKGIGMVLVVLGHSTYMSDSWQVWIISFHMPLFFVIAGMLMRYHREEEKPFGRAVSKRCKKLLPVYLLFSLVNLFFLSQLPIEYMENGDRTRYLIKQIIQVITLSGISVLWFLGTLLISEIVFLFLLKGKSCVREKGEHFYILCISVIMILLMHVIPLVELSFMEPATYGAYVVENIVTVIFRVIVAILFLSIGYGMQLGREKIKLNRVITGCLCILCFIYTIFITPKNGGVDMNLLLFRKVGWYIANAFIGTLAVLLLCDMLRDTENLLCKGVKYIGRNSLIIMLTHTDARVLLLAMIIEQVLRARIGYELVFMKPVIVLSVVFMVEILIIEVVNRYVPFLNGRNKIHMKKG